MNFVKNHILTIILVVVILYILYKKVIKTEAGAQISAAIRGGVPSLLGAKRGKGSIVKNNDSIAYPYGKQHQRLIR